MLYPDPCLHSHHGLNPSSRRRQGHGSLSSLVLPTDLSFAEISRLTIRYASARNQHSCMPATQHPRCAAPPSRDSLGSPPPSPPLIPTSPSKHRWKSWSVFMDSGKTGLAGHFFGRRDFSLAPSWPPSWARVLSSFLPPTEHGARSSGAGPWARGTRLLVSLGRESVALAAWRGSGIGVAMFSIH
jgi:hypothetical protein